jgi:hypothetical protein
MHGSAICNSLKSKARLEPQTVDSGALLRGDVC